VDKAAVIQILSAWSPYHWAGHDQISWFGAIGFYDWGSYLVSVQGLDVSYPSVPEVGNFTILLPILGGAAIIILVAVIVFIRKRRGAKAPSTAKEAGHLYEPGRR
jgi:hypothetical protein